MALNEIVAKQLAALTPEQRQQIKQELIKNPSPANQDLISAIDESNATATGQPPMSMPVQQQAKPSILPTVQAPAVTPAVATQDVTDVAVAHKNNRILNTGGRILSGIGNLAEGALLGLQGRAPSEHTMFLKKPEDKYEELLKTEKLKNEIDPSRRLSSMEEAETKRKLEEQNSIDNRGLTTQQPIDALQSVDSSGQEDQMPPMFIEKNKGRNKYGVMEHETVDNPEYKVWQEKQKEKRSMIQKEEELKNSELIKGPGAESGRVTLAQEALKNIDDIKKILFPSGDSKSFNREAAFGSNPPALRLPLIGRVGASVRRDNPLDPTDNKKAQEAQDLFRKLGASLSARQLIQTGVAARPEETQKLIEQFAPNFFSNPDAALKGLDELKTFYSEYINKTDPETRFNKPNKTSKQSDPLGIR